MTTLIVTGSPSSTSRTLRLAEQVAARLAQSDVAASLLDLRTLPADPLLNARADDPAIVQALERVAAARGVIIATPVYKAAYSGLLKTFLDLLPQFGLRGKVVLPLATGGTVAHVLAIDYALRPVLSSFDPLHVVSGLFILDKQLPLDPSGKLELDADVGQKLDTALAGYVGALRRSQASLSERTAAE